MATSTELIALYGNLRASLLAKHFALGKYFRANHLSLGNHLGVVQDEHPPISHDKDDSEITSCNRLLVKPSTYANANDLLNKLKQGQLPGERWRIGRFERENPLMFGGLLLTCLAVEHVLGIERAEVKQRLLDVLATLASLYKFPANHFDGYILRWDPVTSDRWITSERNGKPAPRYCCEFLSNPDGTYQYCTPFGDPRYTPFVRERELSGLSTEERRAYDAARTHSLTYYRATEPSMDELVGLVLGYDIVFRLVEDNDIKREVVKQVNQFGDYLAEHGYLLVRPCGGFTARGSSGMLPALEFPFGQVFQRITGNFYRSRVGFEEALDQADVWKCLEGPLTWWTGGGLVAGIAGGGTIGFLLGALAGTGIGASLVLGALGTVLGAASGVILGRAAAIYIHRNCFDVLDDDQQREFALAYLLKKLPIKTSFTLALQWLRSHGKHAAGFPPFIGLTGLDDPDTTVKTAYLNWFVARRDLGIDEDGQAAKSCFAQAVAVLLGGGTNEEEQFIRHLQETYDDLHNTWGGDFAIKASKYEDYDMEESGVPKAQEDYLPALDFLAALALAWLHAKRKADAGAPLPANFGFPMPPLQVQTWPAAVLPKDVYTAVTNNEIVLPLDAIPSPGELNADDINLFSGPFPKADVPPVTLKPEDQKQAVKDQQFTVREHDLTAIDTGIDILPEDTIVFSATGTIWAGVGLTGRNGPDGWNRIEHDRKFPLNGTSDSHPFCLIARIGAGQWIFVGSSRKYTHNPPAEQGRLYLSINDDTRGNGDGEFLCRVQVRR